MRGKTRKLTAVTPVGTFTRRTAASYVCVLVTVMDWTPEPEVSWHTRQDLALKERDRRDNWAEASHHGAAGLEHHFSTVQDPWSAALTQKEVLDFGICPVCQLVQCGHDSREMTVVAAFRALPHG